MDQQLNIQERSISDDIRTSETIARISKIIAAQTLPVCLVVTGDGLNVILRYKPKEFIRTADRCQSVLFCRVSAAQKRELVTISKPIFKHRILAIGDGANDVGMIRESHCGVAVYGREGSQAAAAGDFSHLLLVHGARCYTRTLNLILYTSLFTVLPQCAAALFDQHAPIHRALREPQLYLYTLHGKSYTFQLYWINFFDAVWQSVIIFFITYYAYLNEANIDILSFGFSLIFSMMVTAFIHILLQTSRIDWSVIGYIILSFLVFLAFTLVFYGTCVNCIQSGD